MVVKNVSSLILLSLTISILISLPIKANGGGIAIYWGGNVHKPLLDTCQSGLYKFVNIAFISAFGNGQTPKLNLEGYCNGTTGDCQKVSSDITACQGMGIQVMLSIGGGAGNYSLASDDDGRSVADYLWDNYLGGQSDSRPLGDAVLDGIDFDAELGTPHYAALARRLSEHGQQAGKKVYLTAAPECSFPDAEVGDALNTGLFDYVWVQFYNNGACEIDAENLDQFKNSWKTWTSQIPAKKFFVGLPASQGAANSGFVPSETLVNDVIPFVKQSAGDKYGGVMLWNRGEDVMSGYSSRIKDSV